MRGVIDPNVLVAAAVADGVSARLLDHWLTSRSFEIVVGPMLMAELGDVLGSDKFRRWIAEEDVALLLARLEQESETWSDPSGIPEATRDPKDDRLVALYRECGADALMSGDSDLTELGGERGRASHGRPPTDCSNAA